MCVDDHFGERRNVAQPEVEALSGNRVQGMHCIADQRQARRDGLLRAQQLQRVGVAGADLTEAPQPVTKTVLQACQEGRIVERHHLVHLIGAQCPYQ